jgi:hypothetical protein
MWLWGNLADKFLRFAMFDPTYGADALGGDIRDTA